jgi:hypothetical protein
MGRSFLLPLVFLCGVNVAFFGEPKPLAPVEARKKVGEKITVEMKVQAAKDRLEKRSEIYLDAETDFRDEKNFAVVITKKGAASLKAAGIAAPADHFMGKVIRATGTVKLVQEIPRIEIDDAKQIRVVEAKARPRPERESSNSAARSPRLKITHRLTVFISAAQRPRQALRHYEKRFRRCESSKSD